MEATAFHDMDLAATVLQEARDLGVKIALDDFGTGVSSLTFISQLPVDYIKIERSLIQSAGANADMRQLVEGLTKMAHAMKRKVIAEGVETRRQLWMAKEAECDLVQGYLFAKPMPAEELDFHFRTKGFLEFPEELRAVDDYPL